ncbi:MAG: serine/threonine protein kinase [Myxococcales bacterium]|jgi:serine/threonine protein kinase|nr:serine/threonine protein kinase [Myxococcales bacterium]
MAQQQQRYRVLDRIAAGGMAEVFRAESAGLEGFKKTVAIKRVLPHLSEKKQFIGMFLDEARLSAHLSHSNCVQVFDIGRGDNTYFIVMEYVDGSDLKGIIEHLRETNGVMPLEEACLICVRICEGLAYAHELRDSSGRSLNIVHRDMSPPNVLLTRHGEVKIVDFGLAKANSQLEHSEPGIIKGKFSYLSPEAAQGKEVDARTDVFAVGIILWELLAGRRLFQGETDLETVRQVQKAAVPDIRQLRPEVPDFLASVLARALAADPNQRYQSARELGHDLNQVLFRLPRAVSSFDLARLVVPVQRQRATETARKATAGSLIGSLIDEALFEFTSLQDGEQQSGPSQGSAPLNLGSFDAPKDWSTDLGLGADLSTGDQAAYRYEPGNLAALEEGGLAALEEGPESAPGSAPAPSHVSDGPPELPEERPRRGGLIALLVVLALLGGATGAYFAGALPAPLQNALPRKGN